ncbi:MAG TPA: hypothetical protein VD838_17180 [Anaeromyxobacteraceae bacterium]|nr:hypothetical protein [Anaeromyxobacteraceae bacterium]
MRTLFAAVLATALLLSAAGTHAHAKADAQHAPHGERCAVCVLRAAELPPQVEPDLAPRSVPLGAAPQDPGASPVTGAPLGAIPGQSPPCA